MRSSSPSEDTGADLDGAEVVRSGLTDDGLLPHFDHVRGKCPKCGEVLVSQVYSVADYRGFLVIWHCWASMGLEPTCDYRKVL